MVYTKPDRTKGLYNKLADGTPAVTVDGSTVTVILAPQMLTVPGTVNAGIVFNSAQLDQLTTFPFPVRVEKNPFAGAQVSQDYIRLQWLEDKLQEYIEQIGGVDEDTVRRLVDEYLTENPPDAITDADKAEIAQQAADTLRPEMDAVRDAVADVNNTTDAPVSAGKVWTSTENGAGWADPQGGSGSGADGGYWETVIDEVWNRNQYITVVSYDSSSHIFTCQSGELDWADVGARQPAYSVFAVVNNWQIAVKTSEMPINEFRAYSGSAVGNFVGLFTKLSDITFAFTDSNGMPLAVPNESTMDISKFHFEKVEHLRIQNLNTARVRIRIVGKIFSDHSLYSNNMGIYGGSSISGHLLSPCSFSNGYSCNNVTDIDIDINTIGLIARHMGVVMETGSAAYATGREFTEYLVWEGVVQMPDIFIGTSWNDGAHNIRNGGCLKIERWVE